MRQCVLLAALPAGAWRVSGEYAVLPVLVDRRGSCMLLRPQAR